MCSIFHKNKPVEILPTGGEQIFCGELLGLLSRHFPDAEIYLSDKTSTLCTYDDVAYVVARAKMDQYTYEAEVMDCDDFAMVLLGEFSKPPWSALTVGLVWTDKHALNCCVTEDREILFIEPQTGEISNKLAGWQGLLVRLIII